MPIDVLICYCSCWLPTVDDIFGELALRTAPGPHDVRSLLAGSPEDCSLAFMPSLVRDSPECNLSNDNGISMLLMLLPSLSNAALRYGRQAQNRPCRDDALSLLAHANVRRGCLGSRLQTATRSCCILPSWPRPRYS